MSHTSDAVLGDMREIDLHDDFWPGALGALAAGAPMSHLAERWPGFVELLGELVADAKREPLLVGVRLGTTGRNSRLFSILTGACLAREGVRTLVLDLSPDTRWLEQVLGADFKEGLVDHLRFGVPLERCVRLTALDRFSAMSGGASFLAGSPLDDAPGFRAALDRLRQRHRVVMVTLPPPLETGDGTGIAALCGAVLTVEERNATAPLAGNERAVVRLTGDSEAARDLAHLTHRFLGPLTTVIAGMAAARGIETIPSVTVPQPAAPARQSEPELRTAPRETAPEAPPVVDDELAFLRSIAGQGTVEREVAEERSRERSAFWDQGASEGPPTVLVDRPEREERVERTEASGSRRRIVAATAVALTVVVAAAFSARGVASDMVAWVFGQSDTEAGYDPYPEGETIALDQGASAAAPLALPVDTAPARAEVDAADSTSLAATELVTPPRRIPFSLHVGSYQNVDSGMRVVTQIQRAGFPAFLAPVSIPGKGRWQRVYVGSFSDSLSAQRALERLLREGTVEEGTVRTTPWTFQLGEFPTREAARADGEALRRKGITTYLLGDEPVHLYAGAYQTREEAELFARTLAVALEGRTATLILREE